MKKNRMIFSTCLLALLALSCTDQTTREGWDVDLMRNEQDSLPYSLFVDSIRYIPLEATDECIVGAVTDIAFSDDRMFIFDRKQQAVWVFDHQGRYRHCILHRGEGPGEYLHIDQFAYDARHDRIAVLASGQGRILFYTPQGEYLKTVHLSIKAEDFRLTPQGDIILSRAGADSPDAGIYIADSLGQNARPLVLRKENHLVYATYPWELCAYGDVVSFMAPNFDNGVYHWQDGKLTLAYPFHILPEPKRDYRETVSLQHLDDFLRTTCLEGENWILATYWSADAERDLRVLLYSKQAGRAWTGRDLRNDLDRHGAGIRTRWTDGNRFVTWQEHDDPNQNPTIGILYLKK